MNYSNIVSSSKEKVGSYAIATKILDLMDKLRLDENETSKRRWVWELLQNAKDVKYVSKPIHVEIDLHLSEETNYVEFRHDGQPFSVDNLTFLIEQVSTKERNPDPDSQSKSTGKFGTGFLTTHLLSEMVKVNGVLKEPDLPYKPFELTLDRTGRTIQSITKSIQTALEVLNEIEDTSSISSYNENDFNTIFRYELDKEGIKVAKTGLADLDRALPFTLVFIPDIQSIYIQHDLASYQIEETLWEREGIRLQKIVYDSVIDRTETFIISVKGDSATIAVPVSLNEEERITLLPIPEKVPKIHCDFPLIGTENVKLPFIVNSSYFNPNEPRDGIFLTDHEDERIEENKKILIEAIDLFKRLVTYAANEGWADVLYFAASGGPVEQKWLSKEWYTISVQKPLQDFLLTVPLVDTQVNERKSILNAEGKYQVWIPWAQKGEVREKIWELCVEWIPALIPKRDRLSEWQQILWTDDNRIKVALLGKWISGWKDIDKTRQNLQPGVDVIKWLNSFYELVNLEVKFLDDIVANKIAVIPNQNGVFKLQEELYFDKNIDEDLKEILLTLGEDVRDSLRMPKIETHNKKDSKAEVQIKHGSRDAEFVITKINKLLSKAEHENCFKAALNLIALFPNDRSNFSNRNYYYEIASALFRSEVPERKTIFYSDEIVWKEAEKILLERAIETIASCSNLKTFTSQYEFSDEEHALKWLNRFVSFLHETEQDHYLNFSDMAILPNQKGEFIIKDDVFLDDGTIDETIKDICELLLYPFRSQVLDKNIFLELPEQRVLTSKAVAEKVTTLVYERFSELIHDENTKKAFRMLAIWFQNNKDMAASLFSELYGGRHKLYDDEEVISNMQAAEELKNIMEKFDIRDLSELERRISMSATNDSNPLGEPITLETLVSLGIGSLEELEEAMKDVNLAQRFSHTSIPSIDMFVQAQRLIARAKENILNFLRTLSDYNCDEVEELARTVLGGIYFKNIPIHIVCRPSDNGEVIVYYSSEKDTLELADSQLWIDDGIREPRQLTLGKILKDTGINRIPVKYE